MFIISVLAAAGQGICYVELVKDSLYETSTDSPSHFYRSNSTPLPFFTSDSSILSSLRGVHGF